MKEKLAYLAGFFDGEGCISITYNIKRRNYCLSISIANVKPNVLLDFHHIFGGNLHYSVTKQKNRRNSWRWEINGKSGGDFLTTLFPYLVLKKEEARLALEFRIHLRSKSLGRGRGLSKEEREIRESYRKRIRELK